MTGPEHYRKAERLLELDQHEDVAAAHVHATLALAAATALGMSDGGGAGMRGADAEAWERTCSVLPVDDEDEEQPR